MAVEENELERLTREIEELREAARADSVQLADAWQKIQGLHAQLEEANRLNGQLTASREARGLALKLLGMDVDNDRSITLSCELTTAPEELNPAVFGALNQAALRGARIMVEC